MLSAVNHPMPLSDSSNERLRRLLTQGRRGDGLLWGLLEVVAVTIAIAILIAVLRQVELRATEDAEETKSVERPANDSEIGN